MSRKYILVIINMFLGVRLPVDQNGYEYLPPDRVGFGDPLPPRPVKTTTAYATPTALQVQSFQPQAPEYPTMIQISQPQVLSRNPGRLYSHRGQTIFSTGFL